VTDLDPVPRRGEFVFEADDALGAQAAVREDEAIEVLCALRY
jgi:hypothetical protein